MIVVMNLGRIGDNATSLLMVIDVLGRDLRSYILAMLCSVRQCVEMDGTPLSCCRIDGDGRGFGNGETVPLRHVEGKATVCNHLQPSDVLKEMKMLLTVEVICLQ